MRNYLLICMLSVLLITAQSVWAKTETIYASYKYVMGDNDTKIDAKRICFIEAKRLLLERAGVYVESISEISNMQLTRDEIKTYSAAIIKTEIINEEIKFEGLTTVIYMTVKADIDDDGIKNNIQKVKADRSLAKTIEEQQKNIYILRVPFLTHCR